jgi:hypothetical protein
MVFPTGGAIAGMAIGMFSVRQQTFLDLLSIPEDKSPFAYRAREMYDCYQYGVGFLEADLSIGGAQASRERCPRVRCCTRFAVAGSSCFLVQKTGKLTWIRKSLVSRFETKRLFYVISYDEVVWTEPPPPASKQFATLEETLGQAERDEVRFPSDMPGDSLRRSRRNGRQKKRHDRHDNYENDEWTHHATDMGNDGGGKEERKWDEQRQRGSRGF